MTKLDLAYFAGLIDGEGSICISIHRRKYANYVSQLILSVSVSNTDRAVLESMKAFFKFGSVTERPMTGKLGTRPVYAYSTTSRSAGTLLKKLLPFLRIKKPQAILALEFQSGKRYRGAKGFVPQNELDKREKLRLEVSKLNHGD